MRKTAVTITFMLLSTLCVLSDAKNIADPCQESGFEYVLACYQQTIAKQPLQYKLMTSTYSEGVAQRTYQLTSQSWSPNGQVTPMTWQHEVTLYIPDQAQKERALVIANNGFQYSEEGTGLIVPPDDYPADMLLQIAKETKTVVVSVSDVPNQYLTYTDDGKARKEDDSVAHSWTLFMQRPEALKTIPLHVPMMAAISRAMTLATLELAPMKLDIHQFIVSGRSKRALSSWLVALADSRVEAIVPFVIDILNTQKALKHMYYAYGNNWPIAFKPYYDEKIDQRIDTPEFISLMQIEDPLQYLSTELYQPRFKIPKYIVNASGDDFFVPDNAQFYYDKLPDSKSLRIVPNSSHSGIKDSLEDTLTKFIKRLQQKKPLPTIDTKLQGTGANQTIVFQSSEQPTKLLLWSARNQQARDFRYECGIQYTAKPIKSGQYARIPVKQPDGWSAYFVEATFADGFVATSQVYIFGKQKPPTPQPGGERCKTLPGRGFVPLDSAS